MTIVSQIEKVFFNSATVNSSREEYDSYSIELVSSDLNIPPKEALKGLFSNIPVQTQDSISISVVHEDSDPITLTSIEDERIDRFCSDISALLNLKDENDKYQVTVNITKKINDGIVSIYNLKEFTDKIQSQTLEGLCFIFSTLFKYNNTITFISNEISSPLNSKTIFFSNNSSLNITQVEPFNRKERIEKIKTMSHFFQSSETILIPEDFDFDFDNSNFHGQGFDIIFKRMCLITIINALFDVSEIVQKDLINFRLEGYKAITGNIKSTDICLNSLKEYLEVYKWVYSSNNVLDKIGVARNIISLHVLPQEGLKLLEHTFLSIQSSFKIYEKENIKQYIDIRNKISEQIIDYSQRASDIVDGFAGGFQKSIIAVLTFFSSVLVIQVISNRNFNDLFSFDTYLLTIFFIVASLLYYLTSKKDLDIQKERFETSYKNLKKRYTDLLIEDDIKKILNHDQDHIDDIGFINSKVKRYSWLWMIILSLTFIVVTILYKKCSIIYFFCKIF